jgi:hypothetical protein
VLRRVPARARHLHLLLIVALAALVLPAAAASAQSGDVDQIVDLTFPVHDPDGLTTYSNDYLAGRSRGDHGATDIGGPNAYGVRVHAAVEGQVTTMTGVDSALPRWGWAIYIAGTDGRTYRYLHLGRQDGPASEAYAPGLRRGDTVQRGQHIGFIGHSGNASASWPHLHLEISDPNVIDRQGTDRINPYFSLKDAERRGDYPGAGVARTAGSGFADVPNTHAHLEGITFVDVAEISQGCRVDRFCPDQSVTRGQMATFLLNALGLEPGGPHGFSDVPANHPHAEGIAAVAAAGIASGKGDGRFDPQAEVQRGQMATFLGNALNLPASDTTFPDVPANSVHAEAIGAIADEGITAGFPDGSFKPMAPVSRAQMATFLLRALG